MLMFPEIIDAFYVLIILNMRRKKNIFSKFGTIGMKNNNW